jgi:HD superfamily phosphohydrolase YqeK
VVKPDWMTNYSDEAAQDYAEHAQIKLWKWLIAHNMVGASVAKQQLEWMGRVNLEKKHG